MDYETRMALEAEQKKKNQLFGLVIAILILGIAGYFLYGWQQKKNEKKFLEIAEETLKSVKDNYRDDQMFNGDSEDVTYIFPDKSVINFDERTLKGGSIIQFSDGTVGFAIYNDKWCAIKNRQSSNIEVIKYNGNCGFN